MCQMTHFEKLSLYSGGNPADIYLLNVNNRNTKITSEICSKLTVKTPVASLFFLLLTLNIFHTLF